MGLVLKNYESIHIYCLKQGGHLSLTEKWLQRLIWGNSEHIQASTQVSSPHNTFVALPSERHSCWQRGSLWHLNNVFSYQENLHSKSDFQGKIPSSFTRHIMTSSSLKAITGNSTATEVQVHIWEDN